MLEEQVPQRTRRRFPKDPTPRFRPDVSRQLDSLRGCPDYQVPKDHLAREVWALVERVDTSSLEASFSALGRHGFHPRRVLAVLIYGSLIGLHESTKLGAALKTDAALQFLAGGQVISSGTLRRRRQQMGGFFQSVLEQTVVLARELGMLEKVEVAVDSVRLQAHSSNGSIRSLARSKQRVAELKATPTEGLNAEQQEVHAEKLAKHEHAVAHCEQQQVSNFIVGNELASMMKLGNGANAPGHRATVAATGAKERLALAVFVDASAVDAGKLQRAVEEARRVLQAVGASPQQMPTSADAGYWTKEDLKFAIESGDDVLIKEPPAQAKYDSEGNRLFSREHFTLLPDDSAICPAGKKMVGPLRGNYGRKRFVGVGCSACPLKSKCTTGKTRNLTLDIELERLREQMRKRFEANKSQYNKRIAIIEPVFSNIESTMGYRRVTTRHTDNVRAEILLKVIAHNVSRIIHRRRVVCVLISVDLF